MVSRRLAGDLPERAAAQPSRSRFGGRLLARWKKRWSLERKHAEKPMVLHYFYSWLFKQTHVINGFCIEIGFSQLKLCFGCVFSWIQNVWGMVYNTLRCKFWVNRGPTDHIRRNRAVTRVTSASRKINFQTWRQNQQRRGSKQVRRSGCVWKWLIPPISPLTNNHDWPVESGILSNSQRSSQNRWAALLVNKPTRAMASQSTWAGGLQQFQCSTFQDLRWQGRCKQTFQSVCGRKSERTFVQAICPSCKLAVFCGVLLPFPFGKESVNTPRPPVTCKFDQHKAYNPLSTSPCLRTLGSEICATVSLLRPQSWDPWEKSTLKKLCEIETPSKPVK